MRRLIAAALLAACATSAKAWSGEGHPTVGAIAEQLLQGTPAGQRVAQLLGGLTLAQASVWADCARGVKPAQGFAYTTRGRDAECAPHETDAGIAELSAYVKRNHRQCQPAPGAEDCHRGYHYTNVTLQRSRYLPGAVGTRPDDIVGAAVAAIRVLQGQPSPAPFGFASPREALLVLAHLVGDMHQPLHVGAIYLDAQGGLLDPDKTGYDPASFTRGANLIVMPARPPTGSAGIQAVVAGWRLPNLHALWDAVPASLAPASIDAAWLNAARRLPATPGDVAGWPERWASETLAELRPALHGVRFGAKQGEVWTATLPAGYEARMATVKRQQLTRAGARLAQLLAATLR